MKKLLLIVVVLLVAAPLMAKEIELVPTPPAIGGVGVPGHFYNLPPAPMFPSEQELSNDNGTPGPYYFTGSWQIFNTITIPYDCWLILVRGYIYGSGTGDIIMDVLEDSGGTPVWGSSLIGGSVPVYFDGSSGWKDSADFDPLIFFSNGTVTHPGSEAQISSAGICTDTDTSGSGGFWYYVGTWYDYTWLFGHVMARLLVNDDVAGPYGDQYNPADGDTAPPDTNIVWHCCDADSGVDSDTINTDSFLVEVAKSKVSGTITITGDPSDYEVTFDPDSDFSEGDTVNVTLSPPDYAILDLLTNSMEEVTYSFSIGAYVTVQPTSLGYIKAMYE